MFDSPFDVCRVCNEVVLLDQTQAQCAREHGCPSNGSCPLADYFTGVPCGAPRAQATVQRRGITRAF